MITRDQLRRTLIAAHRESPGNIERVIDAVMSADREFMVASDSEPLSKHSPARLYRINQHGHGVLHAQGNLAMMQDLAETLNTKEG